MRACPLKKKKKILIKKKISHPTLFPAWSQTRGTPRTPPPPPPPPPHLPPNLLLQAAEFATPGWKQHISKNVLPHPNLSRTLQFPPHLPYFHLFLSHPSESSFLKSSDFSWFADTLPSSRFSFSFASWKEFYKWMVMIVAQLCEYT